MPDDVSTNQIGLPCCPQHATAPTTRARMKEYFDLGRGHEQVSEPVVETGCQVCNDTIDTGVVVGANESIYGYGGYGNYRYDHPELPYTPPPVHDDGYLAGGGGTYQAQSGGHAYPSQVGHSPSIAAPAPVPALPTYDPPAPYVPTPEEARMQHVGPVAPAPHIQPPQPAVAELPPPPPPPAPIVNPPEPPHQDAPPPQRKLPAPPTANTQ